MRVLIVEDSQTLAEALSQSLQSEGAPCDTDADGVSAPEFLSSFPGGAHLCIFCIVELMLAFFKNK